MDNFWDEDLDNQNLESVPVYKTEEIHTQDLEAIEEDAAFELNTNESTIIFNARLRLEQARLYEMLINHDLFDGLDANPQAIKNVQNELKKYIISRLEVLLGIKQEKKVVEKAPDDKIEVVSDLNDVELDFLKQLAYKGTKGASVGGRAVIKEAKRTNGLNSLSNSLNKQSIAPIKPPTQPKVEINEPMEPLPTKSREVPKKNREVPKEGKPRGKESTIDRIAREQLEKEMKIMSGVDNWKKLSTEEKAARISKTSKKRKISKSAPPMPDADQLAMKYQMEQQQRMAGKGGEMALIASAIAARKQNEEV